MSDPLPPETLVQDTSDFEARIAELRQAASLPGTDHQATLEAALVELDLALNKLRTEGGKRAEVSSSTDLERRVLRTVFHDAPLPIFLLEPDTTVRRVNRQAGDLLGNAPGFTTGKPFTVFCDLPNRAALRSQIAGVVRTGRRQRITLRILRRGVPVEVALVLARLWVRGEPEPLVVAAAMAPTEDAPVAESRDLPPETDAGKADETVAALVHRMDILTSATELLLKDRSFTESVAVRRCARLLAAELADWVIVDLCDADGVLRRNVVMGPSDAEAAALARALENVDPEPGTLPMEVHTSARPTLLSAIEDVGLLGRLPASPWTGEAARSRVPRQATKSATAELAVSRSAGTRPAEPQPAAVQAAATQAPPARAAAPQAAGTQAERAEPTGLPVCALMNATSILAVPLSDDEGDDVGPGLGSLTLAVTGDHPQLDLIDLGLVQRLGNLLALEIHADRVYRRGAEVANALQVSLLPRALPNINGLDIDARYAAATRGVDVGGDFYDVFETPDGWGFALGDVCGKGEDAAAVTATARQGVRLLARWEPDPAVILAKVNEALLADHDRFVTAVLASAQWRGKKLRVVLGSAGHQPSIVIRSDGLIRSAAGGGVPLGLFPDFAPGTEVLNLGVGDTLFMHSDGVLDATDSERRPFGAERLIETLAALADRPVSELVFGVERTLLDFCDGDLRDDLSILALRVLDPPGRAGPVAVAATDAGSSAAKPRSDGSKAGRSKAGRSKADTSKAGRSKAGGPEAGGSKAVRSRAAPR
jgi:serine phosphatase RsbU (regulator of sigma subunit)